MHSGHETTEEQPADVLNDEAEDSLDRDSIIVKLYPGLNKTERRAAEANLVRYCEIAILIAEQEELPKALLTQSEQVPTMKERSNVDLKA